MKLNKMQSIQLETVTPVHIGTGNKTDRFDDSIVIDYKSTKIKIHDYIHNIPSEKNKKINDLKGKISNHPNVYKYEKFDMKYWIIKTEDKNGNETNILFDNKRLLEDIKYTGNEKKLDELNLTNIEYWNVALQNPVGLLPYNSRNFYIPASSIKGAISMALNQATSNEDYSEKLFKEKLFLNRSICDCEIIDRNAMKIGVVNKIEYNLEESEKSVKIQTNPTNQKQFIKKDIKLNLSINEQLYTELLANKKEINKQLVQRLRYLDKKYEVLIQEMIKKRSDKKIDKDQKMAVNKELEIIGLQRNCKAYAESTLAKNLQELITTIEQSEDIYLLLGSNKGKQLIFNKELDAFGLNFIDNVPIGIVKIDGGNNVCI